MPKGKQYRAMAGNALNGQRKIADQCVLVKVENKELPNAYTGKRVDISNSHINYTVSYGDMIRKMKQKLNKNKK